MTHGQQFFLKKLLISIIITLVRLMSGPDESRAVKGGTGVTQWASPASQMPTLATGSPSNFKHGLSGFGCLHMLKQCAYVVKVRTCSSLGS